MVLKSLPFTAISAPPAPNHMPRGLIDVSNAGCKILPRSPVEAHVLGWLLCQPQAHHALCEGRAPPSPTSHPPAPAGNCRHDVGAAIPTQKHQSPGAGFHPAAIPCFRHQEGNSSQMLFLQLIRVSYTCSSGLLMPSGLGIKGRACRSACR